MPIPTFQGFQFMENALVGFGLYTFNISDKPGIYEALMQWYKAFGRWSLKVFLPAIINIDDPNTVVLFYVFKMKLTDFFKTRT